MLALRTLRDVPIGVPLLFALAAFSVGYQCSADAAKGSAIVAQGGQEPGVYCGSNCDASYESWYRHNQEAKSYSDRGLRLMVFSFPIAMTLAIVLAMCLEMLPNFKIRNLLPGLFFLYCGSFAAAALAMLSFYLLTFGGWFLLPVGLPLTLLTFAAYFYSPVFARSVIAERDPSIRGESGLVFLGSLLSIPFGVIAGIGLHRLFPTFNSIYGVEVTLGAVFGSSLALPQISSQSPRIVSRVLPRPRPIPSRISSTERLTIERLVLALGAQVTVSFITMFQRASRPLLPGDPTSYLIAPFILMELPFLFLIYQLLKQPGRQAYTFLIAILGFGLVETFFSPMSLLSYRQIYLDHPIGLLWPVFSGLIYIITGALAYTLIQKTALRPKLWSAILGTAGMFCYFRLIKQITPYLAKLF